MTCRWKEMIEKRDINLCEKCVNVLTSETDLNQIIDCEEKKAKAKTNEDDKKKGKNFITVSFLIYKYDFGICSKQYIGGYWLYGIWEI